MAWALTEFYIALNDGLEHQFLEMPLHLVINLIGQAQTAVIHGEQEPFYLKFRVEFALDDADDAAWFEVQINDNTLTLYHAQHRMQYHMKTARSVNPDQEALAFDHIQMILDALHSLTLLPII